jgi:hypothetical protein
MTIEAVEEGCLEVYLRRLTNQALGSSSPILVQYPHL